MEFAADFFFSFRVWANHIHIEFRTDLLPLGHLVHPNWTKRRAYSSSQFFKECTHQFQFTCLTKIICTTVRLRHQYYHHHLPNHLYQFYFACLCASARLSIGLFYISCLSSSSFYTFSVSLSIPDTKGQSFITFDWVIIVEFHNFLINLQYKRGGYHESSAKLQFIAAVVFDKRYAFWILLSCLSSDFQVLQ